MIIYYFVIISLPGDVTCRLFTFICLLNIIQRGILCHWYATLYIEACFLTFWHIFLIRWFVTFNKFFFQGWIECVGCADRACFDLAQHTNASGEKLVAMVDLPEPVSFFHKNIIPAVDKKPRIAFLLLHDVKFFFIDVNLQF